jgi:hypothetical protein
VGPASHAPSLFPLSLIYPPRHHPTERPHLQAPASPLLTTLSLFRHPVPAFAAARGQAGSQPGSHEAVEVPSPGAAPARPRRVLLPAPAVAVAAQGGRRGGDGPAAGGTAAAGRRGSGGAAGGVRRARARVRPARDGAGVDAGAPAAPGVPRRRAAHRGEDPGRGAGRGAAARRGLLPAARAPVPLRPLLRLPRVLAAAAALHHRLLRVRQEARRRPPVRAPPHGVGHAADQVLRRLPPAGRRQGRRAAAAAAARRAAPRGRPPRQGLRGAGRVRQVPPLGAQAGDHPGAGGARRRRRSRAAERWPRQEQPRAAVPRPPRPPPPPPRRLQRRRLLRLGSKGRVVALSIPPVGVVFQVAGARRRRCRPGPSSWFCN